MTNNNFNFDLMNPADIEAKKNSSEGQLYQLELENIGKEIARLQYHLTIWQLINLHKQLRYKEFLGFKMSDVENEQLIQLDEKLCQYEEYNKMNKRDHVKNYSIGA